MKKNYGKGPRVLVINRHSPKWGNRRFRKKILTPWHRAHRWSRFLKRYSK